MSEGFVSAPGGKKTASGTFTGNGASTKTISLDFTPSKISVLMQYSGSSFTTTMTVLSITYDFSNNYGWLLFTDMYGNISTTMLGYSGNSAQRPSFSNGTLTLNSNTIINFNASYTYEWTASE